MATISWVVILLMFLWTFPTGIVYAISTTTDNSTTTGTTKTTPNTDEGITYPEWHYEDDLPDGPSNWAKINILCNGSDQSPILIDPTLFKDFNTCQNPLTWNVDQTIYNWTVNHRAEKGHTIRAFNTSASSNIYLVNTYQSLTEKSDGNIIKNSQHPSYELNSFHFHWGPGSKNGSEHVFAGTTTTLEVHFIHHSSDYASVKDAVQSWAALSESTDPESNNAYTVSIVAFLFEEVGGDEPYSVSADNVLLQFVDNQQMNELWHNASGAAYLSFAITDLVNVTDFEHNYYHYWGSITVPPCIPCVSWHLAQNTIKIRAATMDLFREKTKIWHFATGAIDADRNFRPTQNTTSCVSVCYSEYDIGNNHDDDMEICPFDDDMDTQPTHESKSIVVWIVVVILVLLLIIAFVVMGIFFMKRQQKQQKDTNTNANISHERVPTVDLNETKGITQNIEDDML